MNINIEKDIVFKITYSKWFFENFQTKSSSNFPVYNFKTDTIDHFLEVLSDQKAFIKGDAINKYIDFLELERTRKTSRWAFLFSTLSILIALFSIIIPIKFNNYPQPPYKVILTNERNNTTIEKLSDSVQFEYGEPKINNSQRDSCNNLEN